jgi:hypothetical protein
MIENPTTVGGYGGRLRNARNDQDSARHDHDKTSTARNAQLSKDVHKTPTPTKANSIIKLVKTLLHSPTLQPK